MKRRWFGRQSKHQSEPTESQPQSPERLPDPDQAWKALSLVNDWIRHAEAKATATLAAAGVTGGVLYNLVHSQTHLSLALDIVATINVVTIIASAGSAVMALVPRLTVRKAKPVRANTRAVSQAPTSGATEYIGHQVHANSDVAHRKYGWANRAAVSLAADLIMLGITAILVAHR